MDLLRRLFNGPYRRARAAEGAGDYRAAAALYAEAGAPEEAANALLFHAARATTLEARLAAYHDALRWLHEDHPRRPEVETKIGLAVIEDANRRGARTAEEKRRLEDAATRLEALGKDAEAATAFELLGRNADVLRCLEKAGEVERLEKLLARTSETDARTRKLRGLVADYEMHLAVGARLQARSALRAAIDVAPEDPALAELLRKLESRLPPRGRVVLEVGGARTVVIGKLPAVLGRAEADVSLRGASVSRRHAEIDVAEGGALVVKDLDSRNGTLVRGVPIGGSMVVAGDTEVGLGDDVAVRVARVGGESVAMEVTRGLDRGTKIVAGRGALRLDGLGASVDFVEGQATLHADAGVPCSLGPMSCAAPITLLIDDDIEVGGVRVEVCT